MPLLVGCSVTVSAIYEFGVTGDGMEDPEIPTTGGRTILTEIHTLLCDKDAKVQDATTLLPSVAVHRVQRARK